MTNLFENIPDRIPDELFDVISETDEIRIERIVSRGHSSPDDFWYDQDRDEFVLVLKGGAIVSFQEGERSVSLNPGDYCIIRAHEKHRVTWTKPREKTVWLAIHYRGESANV